MTRPNTPNMADDVWKQIERRGPDECWPWRGSRTSPRGRGLIGLDNQTWSVPRLVYMLTHGVIPRGGNVSRTCDNPSCCNPALLHLSTRAEHLSDAGRKNLTVRRAKAPARKEVQAERVREYRMRRIYRPHGWFYCEECKKWLPLTELVHELRANQKGGYRHTYFCGRHGVPQS